MDCTLTELETRYGKDEDRVIVAWRGLILDVTNFVAVHPGGANSLRHLKGRDLTATFAQLGHSSNAVSIAESLVVGKVITEVENGNAVRDEEEGEQSGWNSPDEGEAPSSSPLIGTTNVTPAPADAVGDPNYAHRLEPGVANVFGHNNADNLRKFIEHRSATGDTRGYASRWHDDRRNRILGDHPHHIQQLLDEHAYFPLTLVLGAFGTLFNWHVATVWIPAVAVRVLRPLYGAGIQLDPPTFWDYISPLWFVSESVAQQRSSFSSYAWFAVMIFIYAYTFGAICKMIVFGVLHELCHETVAPWVTCNSEVAAVETAEESVTGRPEIHLGAFLKKSNRGIALRWLLKDLSMRILSLPALEHTMFEYYANQHLAHHRYLGAQAIEDALRATFDGTQMGDGDQLAVVGLQHMQRLNSTRGGTKAGPADAEDSDLVSYWDSRHPIDHSVEIIRDNDGEIGANRKRAILKAAQHAAADPSGAAVWFKFLRPQYSGVLFEALIDFPNPGDRDWFIELIRKHSGWLRIMTKITLNLLLHPGHYLVLFLVGVFFFGFMALPLFMTFMALWSIPSCLYNAVNSRLDRVLRVNQSEWSIAARRLWPVASVGIQSLLALVTVIVACSSATHRVPAELSQAGLASHGVSTAVVYYFILSELFVFGFCFHPFLAYFLSVHQSAFDATATQKRQSKKESDIPSAQEEDGADDDPFAQTPLPGERDAESDTVPLWNEDTGLQTLAGSEAGRDSAKGACQPTRSMYGSSVFSWLTMHLTHHVEHHDFPSVPWFYLPTIRRIAPEYYREEYDAGGPDGRRGVIAVNGHPLGVIWEWLRAGDESPPHVYGCANCT